MLALAFALLAVAFAAPWANIPRDNADSAGMLAHLRGHFVDVDLLYDDDYAALRVTPTFAFVTSTGVVSNHWPTGATWLQAPGYGLGLVSAHVLEAANIGRASPFGVVPLLGVRAWAMTLLAFASFAIARAFRRFGQGAAGIAVVAFVFGTPLYHYAAEAPLRPHLWGFVVTLAIVTVWRARPEDPAAHGHGRARTVLLAGLCGLATCVRPQLAVLWLLALEDSWGSPPGRARRIALSFGAFAVWPLVVARQQLWTYGGSMLDYAGDTSHHLRAFAFSPYHGAFVWCPVLLVAAVALFVAVRGRQRGAWLIALIVLHQVWLDASMRDIELYSVLGTRTWSGGSGFGPRKLVDVLPLLLPSALYLCDRLRSRRLLAAFGAVVLAACIPTAVLHAAAFVDPGLVVGSVLDASGLQQALAVAFDTARWQVALDQRSLPLAVGFVVGLLVALPMATGLMRCWTVARTMDPRAVARLAAIGVIAFGLLANLWLSVLMVNSDAVLSAEPARIDRARTQMHPAHAAAVSRIPMHHAKLRAVLGPHAAPPVPATR